MTDHTSYISIHCDVNVSWKLVQQTDPAALAEHFKRHSGSIGLCSQIEFNNEQLAPLMRKIDTDYPEISHWLTCMQQTMETMAEQLSELQSEGQCGEFKRVSISATGIEFMSGELCEVGDRVELQLELLPGRLRMMVIGQVVSLSDTAQQAAGSSHEKSVNRQVFITFEHIRESDQEMLIRHIHQAQLKELQTARVAQGAGVGRGVE